MYTANGRTFEGELVESVKTDIQSVDIVQNTPWGTMLVIDGDIQVCSDDHFTYHYHITRDVKVGERVLLIGGGDGYTANILEQMMCDIVHIEIDPAVVSLSRKYFGTNPTPIIGDGVDFVYNFYGDKFDRIIIDCHDPKGPSKEIYTTEFICACSTILNKWGSITLQLGAPDSPWIKRMHNEMSMCFGIVNYHGDFIDSYFNFQLFITLSDMTGIRKGARVL